MISVDYHFLTRNVEGYDGRLFATEDSAEVTVRQAGWSIQFVSNSALHML
jgi:hypothetical protein